MATAPTSVLVSRAQSGDREAFEQLVKRYASRLERQIRARLGRKARSQVEVEDVLQETFAGAHRSIRKFRGRDEESFYRWVASIAEHLIWNASQKKDWRQLEMEHDLPANVVSPSRGLRREERFDRLEKALDTLTPDQRKAVTMARLEGLKVREVAARMNRSTGAVKKLLARGLLQLRRSFGDTESFHLPDRTFQTEEGDEQ